MGTTLASLFTGLVVYWIRKNHTAVPMGNGFMDMLASSPPLRSRTDFANIIHAADYENTNDLDLVMLAEEAVLTFIKSHMEEEDTIHVKSEILPILYKLQASLTNRAIHEIAIGGNGAGEKSDGNKVEAALRGGRQFLQNVRNPSGKQASTALP